MSLPSIHNDHSMPLHSMLDDYSMKAKFAKHFPVPDMPQTEIFAPLITQTPDLLRTAFNYIIRFYILRSFPNAVSYRWKAKEAVDKIKYKSGEFVMVDGMPEPFDRCIDPEKQYPGNTTFSWTGYSKEWADKVQTADRMLEDAKKHYEDYINTGNMTRKLLTSSMDLAVLDTVIKTGRVFEMPSITVGDVTDLENLYRIMQDSGVICHKKHAFIDPILDITLEVLNDIDDDFILDDIRDNA